MKVVCMFDSVCTNVVSSLAEQYDLFFNIKVCASYPQNHMCCSLQLLLVYNKHNGLFTKKL